MARVFLKVYSDNLNSELQSYEWSQSAIDIVTQAAQEDGVTAINWLKKAVQDAATNRGSNPKKLREFFEEKIQTAIVLQSEPVSGGTRPIVLRVTDNIDRTVYMRIAYANPSDSAGWAAIREVQFSLTF